MVLKLTPIDYNDLNSGQKQSYNHQKLSAILADYGFVTLRLADDWRAADLIAQHVDGETILKVQLRDGLTLDRRHLGKDLFVAFRDGDFWYLYPHDDIVDRVLGSLTVSESSAWRAQGVYSSSRLNHDLRTLLTPYKLSPLETRRTPGFDSPHEASEVPQGSLVAGVDGCRGGWLCVWCEPSSPDIKGDVFSDADKLIRSGPAPAVLAIDIPIGLTDKGPRRCDQEARSILGDRASSVFPAPIRPLLVAKTYDEACRIARERGGAKQGISQQAWAIVDKVRQVDELLQKRPSVRQLVHEVHPELCFWALNQRRPMKDGKRTAPGRQARQSLLAGRFPDAFAKLRERFPARLVAHDDILDALAALWTAERIATGRSFTIPGEPDSDATGLPMRMTC